MTKKETLAILALLNAFYAGGKNDPNAQLEAWYLILQKYDFEVAQVAVLNFAENDTRDYATFPAVGKIVEAIRNEEARRKRPIKEVLASISNGHPYDFLSATSKAIISEELYNEWLRINAEVFANKYKEFEKVLENTIKEGGRKWLT